MVENADASHNLADLLHFVLQASLQRIGGVRDDHFAVYLLQTHQLLHFLRLEASDLNDSICSLPCRPP